MSNKEMDKVLNHDYDGIKEYDNPLPNWWLATFYITIVFAFGYYIYYQLGSGKNLAQEFADDMQSIKMVQAQNKGPEVNDTDLQAKFADTTVIAAGKDVYMKNCLACHGDAGQGLVGPNLADNFWLHGKGTPADILNVIKTGVLDKGMPAWDATLKADEQLATAAFVYSLKGTNPPGAKAPQGEEVK